MRQDLDLDHYRKLMEKERDRMVHQMRAVMEGTGDDSDAIGELTDYDDHPADVGTQTFEREKDRALRDNAHETVEKIEAAIHKMDSGTYGVCDICGNPIPAGRLEAVPYATLCVKCASDVEGP